MKNKEYPNFPVVEKSRLETLRRFGHFELKQFSSTERREANLFDVEAELKRVKDIQSKS